ncbi:MAG TPA: DNA-directed RNA polymerase subunit beta, partial [Candidatus Kapabacteria bacterium]|nr:DNA-directed RNA polymerase subunit beta [Candidatus Kapabacteria bacterium]
AERVIVTQLHRSPGVFFDDTLHPNGTRIYTARIIPFRGSWVEFITDIHDVIYAYIDRKKKFPVTTLLRALGFSSDEQIMNLFELSEDVEPDELNDELLGRRIASDIVDLQTGEIIATRDMIMTEELLQLLQSTEISPLKVFSYKDASDEPLIAKTLTKDLTRNREDALEAIYKQLRSTDAPDLETAEALIEKLFFNPKRYDLGIVGRFRINQKLKLNIDSETTTLTIEDFVAILKHLIKLHEQKQSGDDIDHLGNRRVRTVGEQLTAQFNVGLARMARTIREKLGIHENEKYRPSDLVNARTITSVVNQFFGTNQLSQFMDQTNPLAELTHKRRTSALGPGGLTRERAGFEVRDVHYTHYGRLCPIETPEGPNIGLISSLAIHARVNDLGFIETPYRKVVNGFVTDEIVYLTAEKEDLYNMIPASTEIDDKGKILGEKVKARSMGDFPVLPPSEIHFMDISTDHITSAASSLIPFLEHDDANRALMGSNMQRQAVPLLRPKAPIVGTGMEAKIAKDSRTLLLAEGNGVVEYVCSEYIRIRYDKTEDEEHQILNFDNKKVITYPLLKFFRTNQDTCVNQKPIVRAGERVIKGMPIADGSSTEKGE